MVIVPGDTPLLPSGTLDELVATHVANGNAATLLTSVMADPTGYGRVIRASDGRVLRIVEQGDASPDELDVHEINTSIYAFRRDLLGPALRRISPDNAQGEYYLTDVISVLAEMGHRIGCVQAPAEETQGVNDRWQLALAERELRARTNRQWLLNGVTMLDPRQTFIDVDVQLGRDVTLFPGTILEGRTGHRRPVRDRAGDAVSPTVSSATGRRWPTRSASRPRSERASSGAVRLPPVGLDRASGNCHRCVLHCRCRRARGIEQRLMMEKVTTKRLALYSGRTHPELAAELAEHLDIELGNPNIVEFANGEIRARFAESVRGNDVFIVQSHYGIDGRSVNDSIMEQLIMIDAAYRASAKRITAVCPFYGYARQDRKAEGREPITARLIADMFKEAGAKRMISIDLHSGQIQGFFDGPVDHLTAMPVLEEYVRQHATAPVIVSPDAGRIKVAQRMAQHLNDCGADLAFIYKRRPKGSTNVAEALRGARRHRRAVLHPHRRHDRHRWHHRLGRRAADRAGRDRGVGDGHPRRALGPRRRPAEERSHRARRAHEHASPAAREAAAARSRCCPSPR